MPGKHAAPETFHSIVSDYVTGRARELISEADSGALDGEPTAAASWIGAATETLKELISNA